MPISSSSSANTRTSSPSSKTPLRPLPPPTSTASSPAGTLIPVGIGVVLGVAIVGNVLRFVLHRYEKTTLGFLLGLLIAAPAGLYPFKEGVPPEVGETFEGETVTEESIEDIDPKDWPERSFTPGFTHLAGSAALIGVGIAATLAVGRLGREHKPQHN